MNLMNRRRMMSALGSATLTAALAPRTSRASMANDDVQLGFISCGDRATKLMDFFSGVEGVRVAGLCDPDSQRLAAAHAKFPQARAWNDLRHLIDANDIDATVISTCNHWHSLAAIWSMQAGKHVYVEKPLSHYPWEGQQTVLAARKFNRICQVGTHQRSDPLQNDIQHLLHDAQELGAILSVRCNRLGVRKSIGKRTKPLDMKGVDQDLWFGPANVQDVYRKQLQYDWHWDWNTGSGEMGNWGAHILDDVCNNVFRDQVPYPKRVMAGGARLNWKDAGETPNVHLVMFDTGEIPVVMALSNLPVAESNEAQHVGPASGYVVYCEGGRLEGQRGKAAAFDEKNQLIRKFATEGGNHHHQANFIDAIRHDHSSRLRADVQIGHQSCTWCNVANICHRIASRSWEDVSRERSEDPLWQDAAKTIQQFIPTDSVAATQEIRFSELMSFDGDQQRFTGPQAGAANRLLRREDRAPFIIPDLA